MTTVTVGLGAFGVLAIGMGLSKHFFLYLVLMVIHGVALEVLKQR